MISTGESLITFHRKSQVNKKKSVGKHFKLSGGSSGYHDPSENLRTNYI